MKKPKWVKQGAESLKKGQILRCKVGNKDHEMYGKYAYAVCSGIGFGCHSNTHGNAIFVDHEGFDLGEVLVKRDGPVDDTTGGRWERYWHIDVLVE
jgi:hypothetical protein